MSGIMKLARMLAGNGKLAVGSSISKVTKIGTKIKILNKGQGVFEKTVEKANGDKFKSLFAKKEGLLEISGVNQRGSWQLKPNSHPRRVNTTTGTVYETSTTLEAWVNGLKGKYKSIDTAYLLDTESADHFLYRYLVKQDPKITSDALKSRIFSKKRRIINFLKWSE